MVANQEQSKDAEERKKVRVGVWLVARQLASLRMESENTGRSVADIIRQAIETYLESRSTKMDAGGAE